MFSTIKGAARVALAATIFSVLGLTASAQVIRIGANAAAPLAPVPPAYTCVTTGTVTQSAFFDVQASGAQFDKWKIEGDYTLVGALTANPLQFQPTGYGKVRITAEYYTITLGNGSVTCPPAPPCPYTYQIRTYATKTAEYFKTFPNSAWVIKGPTCLPANNPSVVYTVDPALISTGTQIQSGIGTDSYAWIVTYTSGPSAGNTMLPAFITTSGDGSTIIIAGDDPLIPGPQGALSGSFTVKATVGKCNTLTFKTITVTVAQPLDLAITLNTLPCKPIGNASNAGFSIGNQNGVTYTLTTTGGLTVSPSSIASTVATGTTAIVVSGITAINTGSVIVTAVGNSGTCFGSQTTVLPLTRALSATNSITSATTCVPASTAGTVLTLNSAPVGQNVTYTLVSGASTGWAITGTNPNALGTVTVTTGTGDGVFSASTTGCTSAMANQTVKVRNNALGCVWTIDRTQEGSGLYKMVSTNPACYPSRSAADAPRVVDPLVTYTFTVVVPGNPIPTIFNRLVNFFDNNLAGPYPVVGTTVTGEMLSPASCLFGSTSVTLPRPAPSHPGSPSPSVGSQVVDRSREEVAAFPNPADQQIQIELARVVKGDAQLTLLDATGRVVRQQTATTASASLDTRELPRGLYSLRVRLASGNVYTQPIAISH